MFFQIQGDVFKCICVGPKPQNIQFNMLQNTKSRKTAYSTILHKKLR